jgi:hypothetical protein
VFLLPTIEHLPVDVAIVAGGDEELSNSLISSGLARRCTPASTTAEPAPLVVAWADAGEPIDRIAGLVAPGGAVVIEVDRRRRGRRSATLARISARLAESGCRVTSAHLVTPTFAEPRRMLPVDAPNAVRWHLRTLFVPGTPVMVAGRAMLATISRAPFASRLLGALAPRLLVIGCRANTIPSAEPAIVLTSGYDPGSRSIVLRFGRRDRAPGTVVKVASGAESAAATVGEHQRLRMLHDTLPWELRRALPAPIALTTIAGRTACIQSCAPGPSLNALAGSVLRRAARKHGDLAAVVEWLNAFAVATRVSSSTGSQEWMHVFAQAKSSLRLGAAAHELFDRAEQRATDTGLAGIAVHQHFDAGPWNVHLHRRSLTLVDWEHDEHRPADSLGPPLADVLYLVTYWYFLVSKVATPDAEGEALLRLFATRMPSDDHVVAARRAIDSSLRALGLERSCVPAALVAMWAERAVYTRARRAGFSASSPEGVTGELRPAAFVRILAAASEELFTADGWYAFAVGTETANEDPSRKPRGEPIRG